jgi:hypothetical protein
VAAVVEKHEARVGDVVEDRDLDLEGHHPVIAPVDQEDGPVKGARDSSRHARW